MSDPALKAELMRSLARLVRGLSALFWGLPLTLLLCAKTAVNDWLRPLGLFPPVLAAALLLFGLLQLGHFQKQERVWINALDRAKMLALVNTGLAPFLFWWNKLPQISFFAQAVGVLLLSGLLFLFSLNQVLQRLAAMLPDETLRLETKLFTTLNRYLLMAVLVMTLIYLALVATNAFPVLISLIERGRHWLVIFLVLLPVAMTMSLIWKIKEVILASVFGQEQ